MKASELIKGEIYSVSYDKALSLKFTGKIKVRNQMNSYSLMAEFEDIGKYKTGLHYESFDDYKTDTTKLENCINNYLTKH